VTQAAARSKADRKKQMSKYIPDVARSLMGVLHAMTDAEGVGSSILNGAKGTETEAEMDFDFTNDTVPSSAAAAAASSSSKKRKSSAADEEGRQRYLEMTERLRIKHDDKLSCLSLMRDVLSEGVTEELLESRLHDHVEAKDAEMELAHSDEAIGGGEANQAASELFIAGIESEHVEFKPLYGEDFTIKIW
jgi:hypothetical protein